MLKLTDATHTLWQALRRHIERAGYDLDVRLTGINPI